MKRKITKLISSLLVIASLVSVLTVFASADGGASDDSVDLSEVELLINRTFDEGWDYTNGLTSGSEKNNNIYIDYEETADYNYNYFLRFEASNGSDGFLVFDFKTYVQKSSGTVIKFSFKADDSTNITGTDNESLGRILYAYTGTKQIINVLGIENGHLLAYGSKNGGPYVDLGELTNEWMDIAIVFDWDKDDLTYTLYYGEDYTKSSTVSYAYDTAGDAGLTSFRLGFPSVTGEAQVEERVGTGFCIDDFQVYQKTKEILSDEEVASMGYGERVNVLTAKTIDIQSGSGKTSAQLLTEALCLKVGVNYSLFKNEKRAIFDGTYGAPEVIDGKIMLPLSLILDYIGFPYYVHADKISYDITTGTSKTNLTAGRDSASVNGERVELSVAPGFITRGENSYLVIAMDDVETLFPGWLVTYDDMGLIIIYEDTTPDNKDDNEDIVNRSEHLETMLDIMKKFVFDTVTLDANGNALKESESYYATAEQVYADVKAYTNNFQHPYLGADQDTFDRLNRVYEASVGDADYNAELKTYLSQMVAKGENFYKNNAQLDEKGNYVGIIPEKVPVNVYSDGKNPDPNDPDDDTVADTTDGYDPDGGRLNDIGTYAGNLTTLAFAYQISRDTKYVELAYDWAIALGEWAHWGPGHFLNCAEASQSYALAYDWIYNAVKEMYGQACVDKLAQILFENGVHEGYVSVSGKTCEHPRNAGDGSRYATATNNWNAVCSSGMVTASLAIMDYSEYASERDYLLGNNMINLGKYGLDEYAPDGSYIESATYWAYGTNYFFRMVMALYTATGKDYGFMDTWGIDKTCYYACQIESSDGKIWNYHDGGTDGVISGGLGSQDTSMFFFVGKMLGDSGLISLRYSHITRENNRKSLSLYDLLWYPFDGVEDAEELSLDYYMDGIDAFVSRSSWESGAMYTGLMGGLNSCSHGQIDSGNFIYHNKGVVWIMDLGNEQYNAYQYFGNGRYHYYRASSEGQNVVCFVSDQENIAFGQFSEAGGTITKTYSDEHGAYALLDNTAVYLNKAVFARRGILTTNDRETVVIQDEMTFSKIESVYWIAHTAQSIELDSSGKVAYLTAKGIGDKTYTLRATLVSKSRSLSFSVRSADAPLLDATYLAGYSTSMGGVAEYSRSGIQRLLISGTNVLSFNVAVVFELIEDRDAAPATGYEWTTMTSWTTSSASTGEVDSVVNLRGEPKSTDVKTVTATANNLISKNTAFTEKLNDFYTYLTKVQYTVDYFGQDLPSSLLNHYDTFLDLVDMYDDFREYANGVAGEVHGMSMVLQGIAEDAE